jgi:hypothetical protein
MVIVSDWVIKFILGNSSRSLRSLVTFLVPLGMFPENRGKGLLRRKNKGKNKEKKKNASRPKIRIKSK